MSYAVRDLFEQTMADTKHLASDPSFNGEIKRAMPLDNLDRINQEVKTLFI